MQVTLIDTFTMPVQNIDEFLKETAPILSSMSTMTGFVAGRVYATLGTDTTAAVVTVATWDSTDRVEEARQRLAVALREQNIDAQEIMRRNAASVVRGTYVSHAY